MKFKVGDRVKQKSQESYRDMPRMSWLHRLSNREWVIEDVKKCDRWKGKVCKMCGNNYYLYINDNGDGYCSVRFEPKRVWRKI